MKVFLKSPLANVLLFSLFWALEIFAAKLAFVEGTQLVQFSLQSAFLTLIILFFYMLPKKIKELKTIPFHILKWILIANAIHMGIGLFLSNAGIQLTTAINAGFLMQLTIVTGTVFAWIILKESMTVTKILSMIVIMIGTFLLITKGQLIVPHVGDILLLLACIAWGLGGVLIRKVLKNNTINADIVAFLRPVAGIPVLLLFILLSPLYPSQIQKAFQINIFSMDHAFYVILNAILVSFVWIFVNRTLKIASASYTGLMSSVTPIIVALLAMIFLKERIEGIQIVGILLILAASGMVYYLKFDKH